MRLKRRSSHAPIPLTYPGVYIQEIPSGVRTITGVATSITAFVGRAERGPTDDPTTISSLAEFQRLFGGLSLMGAMSYTVRDFYLNAGNQAIIVRVQNGGSASRISLKRNSVLVRVPEDNSGNTTPAMRPQKTNVSCWRSRIESGWTSRESRGQCYALPCPKDRGPQAPR